MSEIPIPFSNYVGLIRQRKSPYYELLQYVITDMERHYITLEYPSSVIYTINPRLMQKEVERKIQSDKLTTINITRVILAAIYASKLRKDEDYYVTTSSGGRKNYHIRLNSAVLSHFEATFNILSK